MMVGVDGDGVVTGVSIVDNSETAGIGSKVMENEPLASGTGVLDQFAGKSAADGTLAVGTNVEAITGATVSTQPWPPWPLWAEKGGHTTYEFG